MGRPFSTPWMHKTKHLGPCLSEDMDTIVSDYTDALINKLNIVHGNVLFSLPLPVGCLILTNQEIYSSKGKGADSSPG